MLHCRGNFVIFCLRRLTSGRRVFIWGVLAIPTWSAYMHSRNMFAAGHGAVANVSNHDDPTGIAWTFKSASSGLRFNRFI